MTFHDPDRFFTQENGSLGPKSLLLRTLSLIYENGVNVRLGAYQRHVFKRKTLPGFVASIGNLTVGGTGKTPAAAMLASWAVSQGHRVAVLSRGYGGTYKGRILEVSDGHQIKAKPWESGDEPFLLAQKLAGIPVVLSKKRYLAGMYAHENHKINFFVLDDGFQHLALNRDLDIVLMDATRPFGNGFLLPRGPLREPVRQLARADVFVLTRFTQNGSGEETKRFLRERYPFTPVFYAQHLPEKVVFPRTGKVLDPGYIRGKRVVAFAGIARPEVFKEAIHSLGAEIVHFEGFKDHRVYKERDIEALVRLKKDTMADHIVTTEKDWMRCGPLGSACESMGYLSVAFSFVAGGDQFFCLIRNAFDRRAQV